MKRGDTLIRLRRFRVDEMKRRMATLDGMKADAERKLSDLEDSVTRERQRAGDSDIGRLAFPSFLRSIETRRENLRATLKEIERERVTAQADLNAAFQDLKSLEFATEQQAKRVAEIETRRSQSRLDEMALVRHLRKHAMRGA
jgi:flagellar export protein FliJ